MTLIELLVVIVIVGVLSGIAIPSLIIQIERARVAATASEMKSFADGIYSYAVVAGAYPPDNHEAIPLNSNGQPIDGYINGTAFLEPTPIGGRYNWEGPNTYSHAAISISSLATSNRILEMLDDALDDGDLTTGDVRLRGGRPTLVFDQCVNTDLC